MHMSSFNRFIMIGNLTRDPELKDAGNGRVCRLGVAVNHSYKNKQTNAVVQDPMFIDVEVWGPQADTVNQYMQKGKQVLVEGRLRLQTWTDTASGQKRSKHVVISDRVVFLGGGQQSNEFGSSFDNQTEERMVSPATAMSE